MASPRIGLALGRGSARGWPHVTLTPRSRDVGLLEFNRAAEVIAEGRACIEHALPFLRRYL
jgi:NTE family protein